MKKSYKTWFGIVCIIVAVSACMTFVLLCRKYSGAEIYVADTTAHILACDYDSSDYFLLTRKFEYYYTKYCTAYPGNALSIIADESVCVNNYINLYIGQIDSFEVVKMYTESQEYTVDISYIYNSTLKINTRPFINTDQTYSFLLRVTCNEKNIYYFFKITFGSYDK